MKTKICNLLAWTSFFSISAFTNPCTTYLESWDSNWQSVVEELPPIQGQPSTDSYQGVTLRIGFACYSFPGPSGLQFSDSNLQTVVSFVQSHGGLVQMSFGGASYSPPCYPNYFITQTSGWPNNISDLANGVLNVISAYHLDGVDFDIEDAQPSGFTPQQTATDIINFLQLVRNGLPAGKTLTITIPGQAWAPSYWFYLATGVAAINGLVDSINFMEYDIWVNPAITFADQISADLTTYTSPSSTSPAPNYSAGWNLPPSLVVLGIMPGCDDTKNYLSVSDTQQLISVTDSMGLLGMMTWDLDRDAGSVQTPTCSTYPSNYEYIQTIRNPILDSQKKPTYTFYPTKNRLINQPNFKQQPVPSDGKPL